MRSLALLAPLLTLLPASFAQQSATPAESRVEPASDEGRAAMANFRLAEGLSVSLFAAEPMLANPVCLYVDGRGDAYVGESFRVHAGVTDMREHMDWLDRELANRSVADRVEMYRTAAGTELAQQYGSAEDRVRLVRDVDGDGRADEALVFAGGFRDCADGIGAGLLVNGKDVYYTCIPHLWLLRDEDGDGVAEVRRSLSNGYGVHVALLGHDLHGLRIGPDGKLYFSCGDRGFHVETNHGAIDHTHTGAVLRCNLDGSELEVFATGLRNPQELAFDDAGNLFTGDNNSDGGDRARVVQVVEGAESGWRFAFQYVERPVQRGPWNDERLWVPAFDGQAAYILPPIANLADGPSGLAHYPFAGGDPRFAGRFFLCDFRGTPSYSGIQCFELRAKGAGFELGDVTRPVWSALATDADFGPEGDLWFTDWVEGWGQTGKGRIYRVKGLVDPALGAESRALLGEGFAKLANERLVELLDHRDQRVRLGAELELAERARSSGEALALLTDAVAQGELRARRQALWALGVVARSKPELAQRALALFDDANEDAELRAQAARVLGDLRCHEAAPSLVRALADAAPRVRMYAAIGLARLGDASAVDALFQLAREVGASDRVLRHCASFGLAECASPARLAAAIDDASVDARLAAVVALRRQRRPEVARFLRDADPLVALEAARAVHDVPIEAATGELASLLDEPATASAPAALVRRCLAANRRAGGAESLRRLARFACMESAAPELRAEALAVLGEWAAPSGRDPITGEWRPIAPRSAELVPELVRGMEAQARSAPAPVADAWVRLAGSCGLAELAHDLGLWFVGRDCAPSTRLAIFGVLARFDDASFPSVVAAALRDPDGALRAAALESLPKIDQSGAMPLFRRILLTGELAEQRAVYSALGRLRTSEAQAILHDALSERFRVGLMPEEVTLDFILAVQSGGGDIEQRTLESALGARKTYHGALGDYYYSAFGGDAAKGSALFHEKAELSCLRCHPEGEAAGTGVGPDLRGVGQRLGRRQILESIVLPNARVAPGFESYVLRLADDSVVAGRILSEDDELVRVLQADGAVVEVPADEIELRKPDLSAMPEGLAQYLDRVEMRDLVEYVAGL